MAVKPPGLRLSENVVGESVRKSPQLGDKRTQPIPLISSVGARQTALGSSSAFPPPDTCLQDPFMSFPPNICGVVVLQIYFKDPAVSPSLLHQACPSEAPRAPPTPDICMTPNRPHRVSLVAHLFSRQAPLAPSSVHDSLLPDLPLTPGSLGLLPCGPRRGCGLERPGQERGQGRAAQAHHGEAGEQSRGPAGGFELGATQVELAPGQRLHRVLVEAHHLGVTLTDPVRVGDGRRRRRPRGLPVPAAAAAPAAAAGGATAAEGKLRAVAARGRGGLRMHGARCKGAGPPGRPRRQRPPLPAAPPPPPEAAAACRSCGPGLTRPAAKD